MYRARVLLVDDNDDFLDGLSEFLAGRLPFKVVGRAHSGSEALLRVETLRPNIVLMDITLPDMSGLEVTRQIRSRPEAPHVVLMAFHVSDAARLVAQDAGASDLLPDPEIWERLVPALEHLVEGGKRKKILPRRRPN